MDEYRDIIDIIKDAPRVRPPDDFTERVMSRLPALQPGIWSRTKKSLLRPRQTNLDMARALTGAATRVECSFYFIMAGFFYFIVGIVLAIGFKGFSSKIAASEWITLQPQIAFIMAVGFIVLSICLLKKSMIAIKVAHLSILIFVGFLIINGITIQMAFRTPVTMVCLTGFIGIGVLMGAFLAIMLEKYRTRVVRGQ